MPKPGGLVLSSKEATKLARYMMTETVAGGLVRAFTLLVSRSPGESQLFEKLAKLYGFSVRIGPSKFYLPEVGRPERTYSAITFCNQRPPLCR